MILKFMIVVGKRARRSLFRVDMLRSQGYKNQIQIILLPPHYHTGQTGRLIQGEQSICRQPPFSKHAANAGVISMIVPNGATAEGAHINVKSDVVYKHRMPA